MSDYNNECGHPSSFDTDEEQWFSEPPARRPSQRPTSPAPALTSVPDMDDSIADGWFLDL
jgi:hypothetical protein